MFLLVVKATVFIKYGVCGTINNNRSTLNSLYNQNDSMQVRRYGNIYRFILVYVSRYGLDLYIKVHVLYFIYTTNYIDVLYRHSFTWYMFLTEHILTIQQIISSSSASIYHFTCTRSNCVVLSAMPLLETINRCSNALEPKYQLAKR